MDPRHRDLSELQRRGNLAITEDVLDDRIVAIRVADQTSWTFRFNNQSDDFQEISLA